MVNYCSKCGKPLEKDGFCLNCIEFTEKTDIIQDTIEIETSVSNEQPYTDTDVKVYENLIIEELQNKPKSNILQKMVLIITIIGICSVGIFAISSLTLRKDKNSSNNDSVSNQEITLSMEDDNDIAYEESTDELEAYNELEESYVYEADYDEIMELGESTNAYSLFAAKKEDVVPIIDQYFAEQGFSMEYETSMDNTYEIVGDEKITYYETLSMWSEGVDDPELYIMSFDTVTGNLLYVGVYREDKEEAVQLIRKSLETIDPNLTNEQLQETCDNIVSSSDYVDEICGDYGIQGGYIGDDQNIYYYYISSLLDN